MIRFFLLSLAIVLLSSPCFAYSGKVVAVIDGDQLTLLHKGKKIRVALYGIDAPEITQNHGVEARDFLDSFVHNETVEATPIGKLNKGRMAGTVVLGESNNINELMILNGKAWVDRKVCTEAFCTTWIKMEEAARATKKGLWNAAEAMPPWDFRKTGNKKKVAPQSAPSKP